jgi:hypothetical protein
VASRGTPALRRTPSDGQQIAFCAAQIASDGQQITFCVAQIVI